MMDSTVHFWAKTYRGKDEQGREADLPGISVRDHCLNVGCVAEALLKALPPSIRDLLPPGAVTLAALHDIGKLSAGFQQKCPAWLKERGLETRSKSESWSLPEPATDHGKRTACILLAWFLKRWPGAKVENLEKVAHIVGAHHGSLFGTKFFNKPLVDKAVELFAAAREALCSEMNDCFPGLPDRFPYLTDMQLWLVAGLVSVADWIGSDENFFSPPLQTLADSQQQASKAVEEIGWRSPAVLPRLTLEEMFGFDRPSNLQTQAVGLTTTPEVVLVEAAMGAGKTEAALGLAQRLWEKGHASGLYFALPTQVTSNRIHVRVRKFLQRVLKEPALLRLAHTNSWLMDMAVALVPPAGQMNPNEDNTPETARRWFSSAKRALLAPFGVGTIDQALLGVVAAKHFFVRQFALAGKVVVLDEVHTYDLYTGTLVVKLVQALRQLGATVVILSATLTEKRKRQLLGTDEHTPLPDSVALRKEYPLLTVLPKGGAALEQLESAPTELPVVRVRCASLSESEAAAECLRRAEHGECVLWIRNTVAEAQAAMKHLRSDRCEDTPELAVLHSRFPQFRRERLERFWLNRLGKNPRRRPSGCVLVATQVVEQSVDIDADFLLTDLAPTDMLLQRIGRLWRHQGRRQMAARRPASATREVWVNHPDLSSASDAESLKAALGRSARVYASYVLLRSLAEWQRIASRGVLSLPTDIRPLLEATYYERADEPPGWSELKRQMEDRAKELQSKAIAATRVWTLADLPDEEGLQTRWSDLETASLFLVRAARLKGKDGLELAPLHGQPFAIAPHDWQTNPVKAFVAAKTIHRNLVRVDAWLVREGCKALNDLDGAGRALRRYVHGTVALGIVKGEANGPIKWPRSDADTKLFYDHDLGVQREPKKTGVPLSRLTSYEDDEDESRD